MLYRPVLLLLGMVVPTPLAAAVVTTVDVPLPEVLYKPVLLLAGTTILLVAIGCPYLSEN